MYFWGEGWLGVLELNYRPVVSRATFCKNGSIWLKTKFYGVFRCDERWNGLNLKMQKVPIVTPPFYSSRFSPASDTRRRRPSWTTTLWAPPCPATPIIQGTSTLSLIFKLMIPDESDKLRHFYLKLLGKMLIWNLFFYTGTGRLVPYVTFLKMDRTIRYRTWTKRKKSKYIVSWRILNFGLPAYQYRVGSIYLAVGILKIYGKGLSLYRTILSSVYG
jgi:hypothetical protein